MGRATIKVTPDELAEFIEAANVPLFDGRLLTCPSCEVAQDLLQYLPLEFSEKHAEYVVVPMKCRNCKHVFALRP